MILTADIGNSTIALTALEKNEEDYDVIFSEKIPSDKGKPSFSADNIRRVLDERGICFSKIEKAALSSVVPGLTEPVRRALESVLGRSVSVIKHTKNGGLKFAVPEPEKLGLDRIAGSAWAARYPLPAVTVDMGTATVFNVIGKGKIFLGGLIAAGIGTSLDALSDRTAQLPRLSPETPKAIIGKTTAECMLSGAVIGAAAMADGIAARAEAELKASVTLIVTGGAAAFAEPFILKEHIYEPHLLAKGLAYIFENKR